MQESEFMNLTIQVPEDIAISAKNGNAEILGLAKDAATHQVLRHLPVVDGIPGVRGDNGAGVATNSGGRDGSSAALIVIGATVLLGIVGFVGYLFGRKKRKKEAVKLTNEFHQEVSTYVDGVRHGTLMFDDLKKFTDFIGNLTKDVKNKKIKIALSYSELAALESIVSKVTKEAIKETEPNGTVSLCSGSSFESEMIDALDSIHQNLELQIDAFEQKK